MIMFISRWHTAVLATLAASFFSFYNLFQLSMFNVYSEHFMIYFSLTPFMFGVYSATFLIGNCLGLLILGNLITRYSFRSIGLIFMTLTIVCCLGYSISDVFLIDCFLRTFQGLASAASLLIFVRATTNWFDNNTNTAVGLGMSIVVLGGFLGNYGIGYAVSIFGWNYTLIFSGILGVVLLIFMSLFLRDPRDNLHSSMKNENQHGRKTFFHNQSESLFTLKNLKKVNSITYIAGIYLGLMSTPIFILTTLWNNYFLIHHYNYDLSKASLFSSVFFIGMIVGSPIWGRLADKVISQITAMFIGCITVIILSLLFLNIDLNSLTIVSTLFGLGFFSSVQDLAYVIISKRNPELGSISVAVAGIILNILGALMQPLYSGLITYLGSMRTAGNVFFIIIFGLCFITIIILKSNIFRGSNQRKLTEFN